MAPRTHDGATASVGISVVKSDRVMTGAASIVEVHGLAFIVPRTWEKKGLCDARCASPSQAPECPWPLTDDYVLEILI